MSDRMLKHMRNQIVKRSERYVAVREAAISIGVDPGGSECDGLVEELLRCVGVSTDNTSLPPKVGQAGHRQSTDRAEKKTTIKREAREELGRN